jgi:rubrerythrin
MIANEIALSSFVRLVAPLVWKGDERIAEKLLDFAATEAGSALDMFAAAELTTDRKLRRLFFRHALDEARHSRMFSEAARALSRSPRSRSRSLIHATRQNLYRSLGELSFLAFVHLAERRGEAHFRALAKHFRDRDEIRELLSRIGKDERFHVAYSRRALSRRDPKEVRRALLMTRMRSAWQSWRRQGRIIGDLIAKLVLATVFLTTVPFFALASRLLEPERTGWKSSRAPRDLDEARRQF